MSTFHTPSKGGCGRWLATASSAAFIALLSALAGCGGSGGNDTPPVTQGSNDTNNTIPEVTPSQDDTATTPHSRRIALAFNPHQMRMLVAADGSVLMLGAAAQSALPTTPVAGTHAARIDGLPPIASVTATYDSIIGGRSIAIARTGEVWAWGSNNYHEFDADSYFLNQPAPMLMANWGTAKDAVTCGGIALNMVVLLKEDGTLAYSPGFAPNKGLSTLGTVPGLTKVVRIARGNEQSSTSCTVVALTESGAAYNIVVAEVPDNAGRRYPATVTTLDGLPPLQDISCGFMHCVAQAKDGTAWAWGNNGDTGNDGHNPPAEVQGLNGSACKKILAIGNFAAAITKAGGLVVWGVLPQSVADKLHNANPNDPGLQTNGNGYFQPLQFYRDGSGIADIVSTREGGSGSYLMTTGEVLSWGTNRDDELGDGAPSTLDDSTFDTSVKALGINLN